MSDDELIINFLEKSFEVKMCESWFTIHDNFSKRSYSKDEFRRIFLRIFDFVTDNNEYSTDVLNRWCREKERVQIKEITSALEKYKVILGRYNWEILDENNKITTDKEFVKRFDEKYDSSFVRRIFHEWYTEKQYEHSEKLMSNFF